jgi:hypothetical protein
MGSFDAGPWVADQVDLNTGLFVPGGTGTPDTPFVAEYYQSLVVPPSKHGVTGARGILGEYQMTIHQGASDAAALAVLDTYVKTTASGPVTKVAIGSGAYQFTSFTGGETFCTVVYASGPIYGRVSLDIGPQIGTDTTVCRDQLRRRVVPAATLLVANITATRPAPAETPGVAASFTAAVPAGYALSGRALITASQLASDWTGDLGLVAQRRLYNRFVAEYARDGVDQAGLQVMHGGRTWQLINTAASLPSPAAATRLFAMYANLMGRKVTVSIPGAEVVSASTFGRGEQQQFDLDVYVKGRWNQFYCWAPYASSTGKTTIAGCRNAAVAAASAWVRSVT